MTPTERIAGDFYLVKYRDKEDDDFETYAQWGGLPVGWFVAGHSKAFADKHFYFIADKSIQQELEELQRHVSFLQGRLTEKIFSDAECLEQVRRDTWEACEKYITDPICNDDLETYLKYKKEDNETGIQQK